MGEQKHLHHRTSREDMHDRTRFGLDLGGRLANVHPGDSFDLSPHRVGRVCK